jgi:hypothetical protein
LVWLAQAKEPILSRFLKLPLGGGTAGLPVANRQGIILDFGLRPSHLYNRLSENPSVKVGILEAGVLLDNDPIVDIPRTTDFPRFSPLIPAFQ